VKKRGPLEVSLMMTAIKMKAGDNTKSAIRDNPRLNNLFTLAFFRGELANPSDICFLLIQQRLNLDSAKKPPAEQNQSKDKLFGIE
jgi:hypothetical protein